MKTVIVISILLFSQPLWAHHTQEHTMLLQDAEQVIADTQQGSDSSASLYLWLGIAAVLGLGVIKLFNKK